MTLKPQNPRKIRLLLVIFGYFLFAHQLPAGITPTRLTCEYLENPLVDVAHPRLAWINLADAGERGQVQSAWQVRVASSPELLAQPDLWDSGRIASEQSTRVPYAGKPLRSRQECWWQVRVWDRDGKVSEWSNPAHWRMGFIHADEWRAQWIGAPWQGEEALPKPPGGPDAYPQELPPPAPLLRKTFHIDKPVKKAVAFVTGLGYFELYLNGQKVGDDELVPNQTNYGKRPQLINENIPLPDQFRDYKVMYLAYDLTAQLRAGENVVGAILGNGSPRFIGQIHLTYEDGSEEIITSDASWKASKSAILMDLVFHGEVYDARLEQPGWNAPGFDDSNWQPVALRRAPEGKLIAHTAPTDKVTLRLPPKRIEQIGDNLWRVDFGVEISGRLRFHNISGPAGHKVEIKYLSNLYSGDHTYIFSGGKPAEYASRFNWFVFSAVEISNWPGELKPEQITAEAINTEIEESAVFETSNPLLNEINTIWRRSQLDNMHGGLAGDCPHRERAGYTGDGQVACVTVMHNFDAQAFYQKWIADMRDAQLPDGYVPNGAPWEPGCGGGPAWGAAVCIMPWEFYLHYGARDMLEDNYEAMKGYVSYLQTWVNKEGVMHSQRTGRDGRPLRWFNLGDWAFPGESVRDDLVHTFYLWRCADLTAQAGRALGKADAAVYAALAERTRQAFQQKFFDPKKGTYGAAGGDILALKMGVPEEQRPRVIAALKANFEKNNGHLDTGIFGTQFFFEILSEHGLHDLAYQAMTQRTFPSYGYWLEDGATTTREQWNNSGSHNHPMFGGGLVWLYRKLAGMAADPQEPGYRHIIFKPQPVNGLDSIAYKNRTPLGDAGISWRQKNGLEMAVTVPVGCRATVYIPATSPKSIFEGDRPVAQVKDVHFQKMQEGCAVFQVGSGTYRFQVK